MEYSVMVMDAWNVRHVKPLSGRVLGVQSVRDAAEKWVYLFYDKNLKVESVTVKPSCRSANVYIATVNCEGGRIFFLYVF